MAEWQDGTGRRWHPRVTGGVIRRFEGLTGADFFAASLQPHLGSFSNLTAFLFCASEHEMGALTLDQFSDLLVNMTANESARRAWAQAVNEAFGLGAEKEGAAVPPGPGGTGGNSPGSPGSAQETAPPKS